MSSRPESNRLQAGRHCRRASFDDDLQARRPGFPTIGWSTCSSAGSRDARCATCTWSSVARRHVELVAAGVRELVVFHSTSEALAPHVAGLPFPESWPTRTSGSTSSSASSAGPRALLDPRAWLPILRGIARSLAAVVSDSAAERPRS